MELNSIDERVFVDRPGVCGTLAQRLKVGLAGSSDVLRGDRRERDKLDGIDLDLTGAVRSPRGWRGSSESHRESASVGNWPCG